MKLTDVIRYFRDPSGLAGLYGDQGLDPEDDSITIFMKERLHIESDIVFLDEEKTGGNNACMIDGTRYVELLPVFMVTDMVNELPGASSDIEIASRIVDYAINDA